MAFTAVANWVVAGVSTFATVGAAFAAGAYGIAALGAMAAIGAAYVTSRVINGNPNKGNNSASNQGGRIQVAPATNNKIPVIYGNAYVNGMITDARLSTLDQKDNNVMFYCIVLGETTNNINTTYGLEGVYWNDLRLSALSTTSTESHVVKDGRKVVDGAIFTAGAFTVNKTYVITKLGTTTQAQWNTIAGTAGRTYGVGSVFQAATTGASSGDGKAQIEDFIDENFIVGTNQYVSMRVYAGGSTAADQIFPTNSNNKANAYNFWGSTPANPNGDGSWTAANEMKGLVFAIIKLRYGGDKGFTSLPNVTFQIANNVTNPADVWLDYMTSERYGAGIDVNTIDETARLDWYNFCEEDINYTSVNLDPQGGAGTTNQLTSRYSINGVIDTSNQVKTNIDTILQNGGAWMSYNVDTGLWSPIIKKAVTAGIAGDTATYFTASRSGTTLTVATFPSGRIEVGQQLYNSSNTLIGTITAQLAVTAGETAGQKGRYTVSGAGGTITTTTFYTLPASTLEFSDDNIISGISISSTRLEDLYNQVEVEFYNKYNKDQKAYFRNNLDIEDRNPNEPDNQLRMSLDLCNNSPQADIIGQMELRQSRDDLVIEFTSTHYGIQAQGGDVIAVTSELYGWYPKYFRVMRVKEIEGDDGSLVANIQALEYNPDAYTIEPITEFSTAANIGIGVWGTSPNLPLPPSVVIASVDADSPIPNFELQVTVPASGGPFDEIELYYHEGWDQHPITGTIVPGTGSNGAPVGQGLLTVTATTYGNINAGDRIDRLTPLSDIYIVSQITNNPVSKTFVSGGAPASTTSTLLTLNNVTGLIIGNTLTGPGILNGSFIIDIDAGTNTVRIEDAVTAQAGSFTSTGSTISGTTLTIGTLSTGSIVIGQTLTGTGVTSGTKIIGQISTGSGSGSIWTVSASQTVTSTAITGTSIYAVTGGLGTYIVDTSTTATLTAVNLYDFPETDNYKPLKKIVPAGNDPTFTNSEVVRDVITNVPANSATYRRWFVIARMGIKKQFGTFSEPGDTDFDQGRFPYNPNPGGSGLPGSFGNITIGVVDANTISTTTGTLFINGALTGPDTTQIFIGDDAEVLQYGFTSLTNQASYTDHFIYGQLANRLYNTANNTIVRPLRSEARPGTGITPAAGFGVGITGGLYNTGGGPLDIVDAGNLDWYWTTPTKDNESANLSFKLRKNGSTTEKALLTSDGDFQIDGDLTVDGGNINLNGQATLGVQPYITFATQTVDSDNPLYGIRGMSTVDDPWFVGAGSVGNDGGYLEIATGDNSGGTNSGGQIYVRQYSGESSGGVPWYGGSGTIQRTLTLLDNVGYTSIPLRLGINNTSPTVELDVNGVANIETRLTVPSITTLTGDDLSIAAFAGKNISITGTGTTGAVGGKIDLTTNLAESPVSATRITANTSSATRTLTLRADSSGTPAVGFGGQLVWEVETTAGTAYDNFPRAGYIEVVATDVTASNQKFKMNFGLMNRTGTIVAALPRMELDGTGNLQIDGALTVSGDVIKKSAGTTVLTFSATNLVTTAGDIEVGGGDIRSPGGTTAITLSGDDVTVVGDLTLTNNTIKSSTATAITLSGANVEVVGTLEVNGNQIKNSAGNTVVTMSGLNTTLAGTLELDGNEIKSSTGVTAITLSGNDVTVADNLTVSGLIIAPTVSNTLTIKNTTTNDTSVITKMADNSVQIDDLFYGPVIKATQNLIANEYIVIGDDTTDNGDNAAIVRQSKTTAAGTYGKSYVQQEVYCRKASGGTGTVTDMMQELVGSSNVVIPGAAPIGIRSAKLRITVERNLETQIIEMLVVSDGTTVNSVISSDINTGINLATFATSITGGSPAATIFVKATATGAGNYYTIDIIKYYQQTRD